MRRLVFLLTVLGVVAVACAPGDIIVVTPTPDPTPTQEVADPFCYGIPGEGFAILNANPCLKFPVESTVSPGPFQADVVQWIPVTGWEHYNRQRCLTPDATANYAGVAPIIWDEGYNYRVDIEAICGFWGYEQVVTVGGPGCYIGKFGYDAIIHDPDWADHDYNFAVFMEIIRADGEGQRTAAPIQVNGRGESFVTIRIANPGDYILRMGATAAYPSAQGESWIGLQSLSFAWDVDGDHCHDQTPDL